MSQATFFIYIQFNYLVVNLYYILNEHNFVIDKSKTVFYGTCEKCRKKKECNNEENNKQRDEKSNEKCCSKSNAKYENET